MTKEKIGSFWVDTGTVLVGDPCQVIPERGQPPRIDYDRFIELAWEQGEKEPPEPSDPPGLPYRDRPAEVVRIDNSRGLPGAFAVSTKCDGWYPVYLVKNAKGEAVRIVIELGGRVEQ